MREVIYVGLDEAVISPSQSIDFGSLYRSRYCLSRTSYSVPWQNRVWGLVNFTTWPAFLSSSECRILCMRMVFLISGMITLEVTYKKTHWSHFCIDNPWWQWQWGCRKIVIAFRHVYIHSRDRAVNCSHMRKFRDEFRHVVAKSSSLHLEGECAVLSQ